MIILLESVEMSKIHVLKSKSNLCYKKINSSSAFLKVKGDSTDDITQDKRDLQNNRLQI